MSLALFMTFFRVREVMDPKDHPLPMGNEDLFHYQPEKALSCLL